MIILLKTLTFYFIDELVLLFNLKSHLFYLSFNLLLLWINNLNSSFSRFFYCLHLLSKIFNFSFLFYLMHFSNLDFLFHFFIPIQQFLELFIDSLENLLILKNNEIVSAFLLRKPTKSILWGFRIWNIYRRSILNFLFFALVVQHMFEEVKLSSFSPDLSLEQSILKHEIF